MRVIGIRDYQLSGQHMLGAHASFNAVTKQEWVCANMDARRFGVPDVVQHLSVYDVGENVEGWKVIVIKVVLALAAIGFVTVMAFLVRICDFMCSKCSSMRIIASATSRPPTASGPRSSRTRPQTPPPALSTQTEAVTSSPTSPPTPTHPSTPIEPYSTFLRLLD